MLCTIPGEGEEAEFLEAELVNVSSSGMLVSGTPLPIGAVVDFQFKLDDGLVALSGRAEVVRTVAEPPRPDKIPAWRFFPSPRLCPR